MSSVSSNEGMVGTRRPPTSLSVLSASSLAEVTKTIRERHSSAEGLSPPPRVISVEDSRGLKIMTELVECPHPTSDNNAINSDEKPSQQQLTSKYVPLRPIKNKRKSSLKLGGVGGGWPTPLRLKNPKKQPPLRPP